MIFPPRHLKSIQLRQIWHLRNRPDKRFEVVEIGVCLPISRRCEIAIRSCRTGLIERVESRELMHRFNLEAKPPEKDSAQ